MNVFNINKNLGSGVGRGDLFAKTMCDSAEFMDRMCIEVFDENIDINGNQLSFQIDVSSSNGFLDPADPFEKADILFFAKVIRSVLTGRNNKDSIDGLECVTDFLNARYGTAVKHSLLDDAEVVFFAKSDVVRFDMNYYNPDDTAYDLDFTVFMNKALVLQDNPEQLLNM